MERFIDKLIFLDHQSVSPVFKEALELFYHYSLEPFSPVSIHQLGIQSKKTLESALESFSSFIGCSPDELVFTGGIWEAIILGIEGFWRKNFLKGKHILTSPIEQRPILLLLDKLKREGAQLTLLPVDKDGMIDPKAIEELSTPQTILCCLQWINPEIGTIQKIKEAAEICEKKDIAFFCDGSYAGGWIPIDLKKIPISLLALNPNQFNGPKGIGILYIRQGIEIEPIIPGLNRELGLWGGTENMASIVAAAKAAEITAKIFKEKIEKIGYFQKMIWERISASIPMVSLNGPQLGPNRSIQNLNISPEFIGGEAQVLSCDMKGVLLSSGPSCVQKNLRISHVFKAVGLEYQKAMSSVRISLGITTTKEEIERFLDIYIGVVTKLREMSIGWKKFLSKKNSK
ncbi:cysteine sulfinate desulfinase [Methylacidiphilum sp. Yel]|uniref:cysteine desulfurase family protein n=1 Tax=Methylacidiphilum sp. Yel TaxID=1847730 RepID=UPI00106B0F9E|nr:cysteine desulfurase family protein [Methylacidiphilum sp. Yel]TFE67957.1 cysteine sulfinate desulfinase [Methylacidiphilum sp. Yel]